jgi:hypothetical protein
MATFNREHWPHDPWFEERFAWLEELQQERMRQLHEAEQAMEDAEEQGDEDWQHGDFSDPGLEEFAYKSRFNLSPEEKQARLEREERAKQLANAQAEKALRFYNVINELAMPDLKSKLSLFLGIATLSFFHKDQVDSVRFHIQQDQSAKTAEHLLNLYQRYQWKTPITADKPELAFNLSLPSPRYGMKSPLVSLNQALLFLAQHYADSEGLTRFYDDLIQFLGRNPEPSDLFDISEQIRRLICLLIVGYDMDEVSTATNQPIQLVDGCAGLGLLTLEQPEPFTIPPIRQLEMTDPVLETLAQQLTLFKTQIIQAEEASKPSPDKPGTPDLPNHTTDANPLRLHTQLNNPLSGRVGAHAQPADIYLSFPKMPYALDDTERQPTHRFGMVHYDKPIPKYASDAIWVQYALHRIKDEGIGFLLVQDGFLRRSGYDSHLRQLLVNNQWVDFVISLHPDHARQSQYNQVSLLVLNKRKQKIDNHQVRLLYLREYKNLYHSNWHGDDVLNLCLCPFWDERDYGHAEFSFDMDADAMHQHLDIDQLKNNDYNLSFEHYLSKKRSQDYPNRQDTETAYREAKQAFINALEEFDKAFE